MNKNANVDFIGTNSNKNILNELKLLLNQCDHFSFSVSFIKKSGLNLLKDSIENALKRGAVGEIITTDYMHFTDIESCNILCEFGEKYKNFNAYMFKINEQEDFDGFHTKGYIFSFKNLTSVIIGSVNITGYALQHNAEWSLLSTSLNEEEYINTIKNEFDYLKNLSIPLDASYIDSIENFSFESCEVIPNEMQKEALVSLRKARLEGHDKVLILSTMASGKTLLSAFDTKIFEAKKILYLAPNSTILGSAKNEFKKVYGEKKTYGTYDGYKHDYNVDILFGNISSIYKHMNEFNSNDFDYIIADEAQHAPADTFKQTLLYFKPEFLLGLSGNIDRLDNADVKGIFGDFISYELTLREAINNNIVMPFKYIGVKDDFIDYGDINDVKLIGRQLCSSVNIDFIDEEIKKVKNELDGKIKCLAFCKTIDHAKMMSEAMKNNGYKTAFMCGTTSIPDRDILIRKLQDENDPLQIIFAVDVLNEGVDIPRMNLALFLRPTESSLLFSQQLGRALRKAPNKKRPIILDFIGNNYKTAHHIARALYGLVESPISEMYVEQAIVRNNIDFNLFGVDIHFEEKSSDEIAKSLEGVNYYSSKYICYKYRIFKIYLDIVSYPSHQSFLGNKDFDLIDILNCKKYKGSYYEFLKTEEPRFSQSFTESQVSFLNYLYKELPLIRPYEFEMLKFLLINGEGTIDDLKNTVNDKVFSEIRFNHALKYLLGEENQKNIASIEVFDGIYKLCQYIDPISSLDNIEHIDYDNLSFNAFVLDLLEYGLKKYYQEFGDFDGEAKLYSLYSRIELKRATCKGPVSTVQGGLFYSDEELTKLNIFIDLNKEKDVEEHLNYSDGFIDSKTLMWESSTRTTLDNNRGTKLIGLDKVHIFVRKCKEENGCSLRYVYLGTGHLTEPKNTENQKLSIIFKVTLDNEIPNFLYSQLTAKVVSDKYKH
ncbi:MAG: DUF3427 domain-containing protein [Bacilli bacterium]